MYILTFSWPTAMVMAAAEVKPLITGTGMKSTKKPTGMKLYCVIARTVILLSYTKGLEPE